MQTVALVTSIAAVLTILALVVYLTTVALMLRHVSFTLGTIIAGLRAIALQAEPLRGLMTEIEGDLAAVRSALEQALAPTKTTPRTRSGGARRR